MNKYISKVRFATLKFLYITRTKIIHKYELNFGKEQTVSITEKNDCKQIMK